MLVISMPKWKPPCKNVIKRERGAVTLFYKNLYESENILKLRFSKYKTLCLLKNI